MRVAVCGNNFLKFLYNVIGSLNGHFQNAILRMNSNANLYVIWLLLYLVLCEVSELCGFGDGHSEKGDYYC